MAIKGSKTKLKRLSSPQSMSKFKNKVTQTQSQVNLVTAANKAKTIKPVVSKAGKKYTWNDPKGASITRDKTGRIRYKKLKVKK